MEATILVIDDDEELSELLRRALRAAGFEALLARDGVEGLALLQKRHPDLVLLDVVMPRMDGWEACHQIRRISKVPIIFLTCRSSDYHKVRGLELGADGYLIKPCGSMELVARIRAALRRSRDTTGAVGFAQIDDRLAVDQEAREVLVNGQAVPLTEIEYKLLACLILHAGKIVTHQSLLTEVWGWEFADQTEYLKVHIHHLRKKIEVDPDNPCYIVTERGVGYGFKASHVL